MFMYRRPKNNCIKSYNENTKNMKTISELNEKWWYRLLKVTYIIFAIFCYSIAIASISGAYLTIEDNKKEFIVAQKINDEKIQLIEELKSKGYTTAEISEALKKKYYRQYETLKLTEEQFKAIYGENTLNNSNSFEQKEIRLETPGTLKWLLLIVPGSIFIAWLILYLVRIIFYYVVLGSTRPKKS